MPTFIPRHICNPHAFLTKPLDPQFALSAFVLYHFRKLQANWLLPTPPNTSIPHLLQLLTCLLPCAPIPGYVFHTAIHYLQSPWPK
jgi:hypothetical protein